MGVVRYTLDADMAKAVDGFLKVVEAQKKGEKQFIRTTRAAQKQEKVSVTAFTNIHKSLLKIASAAGGIYGIQKVLTSMVGAGFSFNKTLESSRLGIASLVAANYDMITAEGKRLKGLEKINAAQKTAKKLQDDIRIAGLKTTATYEQLIEAFQTALAPGSAIGLGLEQIQQLTVQITQAAGAIGLPMNQLAEEIRSIFQGTITPRNTRIATALGITNEDIRRWKEAGTLFEELTKKFSVFSDAGMLAEQTWAGLSSNLIDALQNVLGEGFKPLFEFAKAEAQDFMDSIIQIKDGVIELNPELVALGQRGSEALIDLYKIGKDIAWVFGQIAKGADKAYQTIGSWKHYKSAVEDLYKSISDIWAVIKGEKDWRTGAEIYQPGTRIPIPPRPQPDQTNLKGKPTPPEIDKKLLEQNQRNMLANAKYMMDVQTLPEFKHPANYLSETEYDYFFGGGHAQAQQFGTEEDPLKQRLQEQLAMIDQHHAQMLEKAIQFHNADQAIKDANAMADRMRQKAQMEYEKQVWEMRIQHLEYYAGYTANNFKFLAEHAGKYNKEMFAAYKAFAITQTIIQTYEGAQKAFTALAGIPIVGPALGTVAAAAAIAAGMMRVRMITKEQPKGYAMGGVVNPTGDPYGVPVRVAERQPEAIVPLPDGRAIPVQLQGSGGGVTMVSVYVGGDVYDQRTMTRLVASVSESVTRAVMPGAFREAYRYNQGGVRDVVRSGM